MGENCTSGLDYCGANLLLLGDYYYRIADEIRFHRQLVDEAHVHSTLFRCNADGSLSYREFCGDTRCRNATSKTTSDHCWTPSVEIFPSSATITPLSFPTTLSTVTGALVPSQSAPVQTQLSGQQTGPVSHNNYIAIAVGVGVGVTVFVIAVFMLAFWWLKRKRSREVLEVLDSRAHSSRMNSPNSERGRTGYGGFGGKELY